MRKRRARVCAQARRACVSQRRVAEPWRGYPGNARKIIAPRRRTRNGFRTGHPRSTRSGPRRYGTALRFVLEAGERAVISQGSGFAATLRYDTEGPWPSAPNCEAPLSQSLLARNLRPRGDFAESLRPRGCGMKDFFGGFSRHADSERAVPRSFELPSPPPSKQNALAPAPYRALAYVV